MDSCLKTLKPKLLATLLLPSGYMKPTVVVWDMEVCRRGHASSKLGEWGRWSWGWWCT